MKSKFIKTIIMLTPIFLGVCMIFVFLTGSNNFGLTIFEAEQDYKLKFVDSNDYLTLGDSTTVILPFEILSAEETSDGIVVTTNENEIIYSPISCEVVSYDNPTRVLELCANSIKIRVKGIVSGVKTGDKIACGQIMGTVEGNSCIVEVYWGSKRLTLRELKAVM